MLFGRKKSSTDSAAILPAAPQAIAPVAEAKPILPVAQSAAKVEDEDVPPMPGHLARFGKPGISGANGNMPATESAAGAAPQPANQGPGNQGPGNQGAEISAISSNVSSSRGQTMSDTPATPVYRPEIAKRPAMDLGPKPVAPAAPAAAAPAAAPAAPRSNDAPEPKVLIIGREISLNGQITACDKVVVEGKVEATLTDSRFIEIAETGQFKGSAEIDDAEIRGRFEGKLTVRGRLLIRGTGKVMGEIAYGQIEVECGGEITGTVQTSAATRLATSHAAE